MFVRPKKSLGQHFLKDMGIASDIADTVDACPGLPILEVGPGTGVLTRFLLRKGRPLKVVEIDDESVKYLKANIPALDGHIIEEDFLQMDLGKLFGGQRFVLTGNYPYNISSQIFFRLLEHRDTIPCCTGMIQKEVAERLTACPGSKAYGILSVLLQAFYCTEYLFTVEAEEFLPPPKVRSCVIRLIRNDSSALGCDEKLFVYLVKKAFNQRRKTLRNAFKGIEEEKGLSTRDFPAAMLEKRAEQLGVEDYVALVNLLQAGR